MGTNTHHFPHSEPHSQIRPLHSWMDHETAYRACHTPFSKILTHGALLQSPIPRHLLWNPYFEGNFYREDRTPPFPNDTKTLGSGQNPQRERIFHSPMRPPLYSVSNLDTKTRRKVPSYHLTLARMSGSTEPPSGSEVWACHNLGTNPTPTWCFQTSVPHALADRPSTMGLQNHTAGLCLPF